MSEINSWDWAYPQSLADSLVRPCGAVIKNRFLKSAMSEVLADRVWACSTLSSVGARRHRIAGDG